MNYVDAGYAVALGATFVYAASLVLRRRRWERAWRTSDPQDPAAGDVVADRGSRS